MKNEVEYIKRQADNDLEFWAKESKHKPLLLRGARQVGKSSAIRNLAKKFEYFIEVNFEKNAEARKIFETGNLSPQYLCEKLAAAFDVPIEAGKTLLFLDEIQSCLPAISSLRFFYEDFPALHVVAAGLVIPVTHTSANGLPLDSEINPKFRKMFLLDTGVFQRLLGLKLSDILLNNDFDAINKGGIAEMFAGLELLKSASPYEQTQLFYWTREERNSRAEVDFVVQIGDKIVPIEVKSGKQGKMQSIWIFLNEKKSEYGIRTSLENFAGYNKIKVVPLYAIKNVLQT